MTFKFTRAASACLLAAALAACGGAEERKAEHLKKAVEYFDQKNLEKAQVEFKNVLQIDPKAAQPYYYLGRIEEGKKNWREAFGLFQKAVELDPNYRDAQLKLAQFWLLAKDVDKAAALLEPVAKERPNDLDVRMLQVAVANNKGQGAAALAQIEQIVAEKPARPEPYVVLAALYAQNAKMAEAEKALRDGLAANPKNPELLGTLVRFYQQQKQAPQAEQAVRDLIAAQPDHLPHRVLLVELYVALARWDDAEKALRQAAKDFPEDASPALLLAEFFIKRGDVPKAEAELKSAIAARPKDVKLTLGLAQLLEQTQRAAEAEKLCRDFAARADNKPDALKAKNALAGILARQGRADESQALAKEILEESPHDHDALLLNGKLALAKKSAQDAIAAFGALVKDQPDSAEALSLLARAYFLDGKTALAQENLEKAAAAKPDDLALRKNLVEFLVQQKNTDLALQKIDDFLKVKPGSLEGLGLKADVQAAAQQLDALEATLKEMAKAHPESPVPPMRLGGLYNSQKKYEQALAEYENAVKLAKNDYEPVKSLVGVYLEMKQPDKGMARIKKELAADPKNPAFLQLQGALLAVQGKPEEAVKSLKAAIDIAPRWLLPYVNIGEVYERKGDKPQALAAYLKAAEVAPGEPGLKLNLARLYEGQKEFGKAVEQYEAVLKIAPDNLLAVNNLASLLSLDEKDKAKMDRAFELAQRLEKSGQPVFVDTLAWIHYQRGEYDKAEPLEAQVVEKLPEVGLFQYHLGMIYHKQGNAARAKEHLAKAVQAKNEFPGMQEAKDTLKALEATP